MGGGVRGASAILATCAAAVVLACSGLKPRATAQAPTPEPPAAAPPASAASTSGGLTGSELIVNDCVMCHDARLLRQQRLTAEQWTKTADKMQTWGAPTEPGDLPVLTAHLAGSEGRDAGRFEVETITASQAAALFAPQPDGPLAGGHPEHGAELYDYQCVSCHEKSGLGGPQGVALAGRLVLDRPADFAQVVRSGRGGMPDFSDTSDADMADLLAYLRSLR
jgi:mono/diheme cytochrome c family protein